MLLCMEVTRKPQDSTIQLNVSHPQETQRAEDPAEVKGLRQQVSSLPKLNF